MLSNSEKIIKHKIGLLNLAKACKTMGIKQAFTSYGNPKGNADTERVIRTLKEELVWLNEWATPDLFFKALKKWVAYNNNYYLHSTLNYTPPGVFEKNYYSQNTLSLKAC